MCFSSQFRSHCCCCERFLSLSLSLLEIVSPSEDHRYIMTQWDPKDPAPDKLTKLYNMTRANTSSLSSVTKYTPDELHDLIGRAMPIPDISLESGKKYLKNNLAYWLTEAWILLFDLAFPWGKELADTHRRIIDLQVQVIQLKDEVRNVRNESAALTKTVQRDLKSYSTILTENYSTALAPIKI
eukprot:sb/3471498/